MPIRDERNSIVGLKERFRSRAQHLCKFIGTKENFCIRNKKEFNSHRTGSGHQHGRRFIVLGHQYGRRDVMWKHSLVYHLHKSLNFTKKQPLQPETVFFSVWKVPSGNTGLLFQMFSLLRNIFFGNDTKSSAPCVFQTDLSGNVLFFLNWQTASTFPRIVWLGGVVGGGVRSYCWLIVVMHIQLQSSNEF